MSARTAVSRRLLTLTGAAAVVLAVVSALPSAASADPGKLSKGLARSIAAKPNIIRRVIIEAPQSVIDRLAQSYGMTIAKRLDMGAVLVGNGTQIQALANDDQSSAVEEDALVVGTMDITTQSTGANQLWAGGGKAFGGLVGTGVTIASIDSGIASSISDVSSRVLTNVDQLTGGDGTANGLY